MQLNRRGLTLLARYILPAIPRGRYRFEAVRAVFEDPFGARAGRASSWAPSRRSSSTRGSSSSTALFSEAGGATQAGGRVLLRRTAGFDLHSVREYQQGESLRKVHWPTTARRGALMVKELEDMPHDEVGGRCSTPTRGFVVGESFDVQVRAAGSILRAHAMRRRGARC